MACDRTKTTNLKGYTIMKIEQSDYETSTKEEDMVNDKPKKTPMSMKKKITIGICCVAAVIGVICGIKYGIVPVYNDLPITEESTSTEDTHSLKKTKNGKNQSSGSNTDADATPTVDTNHDGKIDEKDLVTGDDTKTQGNVADDKDGKQSTDDTSSDSSQSDKSSGSDTSKGSADVTNDKSSNSKASKNASSALDSDGEIAEQENILNFFVPDGYSGKGTRSKGNSGKSSSSDGSSFADSNGSSSNGNSNKSSSSNGNSSKSSSSSGSSSNGSSSKQASSDNKKGNSSSSSDISKDFITVLSGKKSTYFNGKVYFIGLDDKNQEIVFDYNVKDLIKDTLNVNTYVAIPKPKSLSNDKAKAFWKNKEANTLMCQLSDKLSDSDYYQNDKADSISYVKEHFGDPTCIYVRPDSDEAFLAYNFGSYCAIVGFTKQSSKKPCLNYISFYSAAYWDVNRNMFLDDIVYGQEF